MTCSIFDRAMMLCVEKAADTSDRDAMLFLAFVIVCVITFFCIVAAGHSDEGDPFRKIRNPRDDLHS